MNLKINTSFCLEKHTTSVLRFILIIVIMLNHYAGKINSVWLYPFLIGGYSAVALFFFLSGYGNYKSINENMISFVWLFKRFGHIIFSFVVVLLINFVFLALTNNSVNGFLSYLFSLSIPGQTLWYIKIQLLLYVIFAIFFSLSISNKNKLLFTTLTIITYIIIARMLNVAPYWYMTCIFFPFGICFALFEDDIFKINSKMTKLLSVALGLICVILFCVQFLFGNIKIGLAMDALYESFILLFTITILMQINVRFKILETIGNSSFELYMTHLVLLNTFVNLGVDLSEWYVVFIWFIGSILLALCVNKICTLLLNRIIIHITNNI